MPRRNVRFVVRRGRVLSAREKRRFGGAKIERVPVPVRSGRMSPVARTSRMRLRYWSSSCGRVWALSVAAMVRERRKERVICSY